MPHLIESIGDLTDSRDEDELEATLAAVTFELGARRLALWRVVHHEGGVWLRRRLTLPSPESCVSGRPPWRRGARAVGVGRLAGLARVLRRADAYSPHARPEQLVPIRLSRRQPAGRGRLDGRHSRRPFAGGRRAAAARLASDLSKPSRASRPQRTRRTDGFAQPPHFRRILSARGGAAPALARRQGTRRGTAAIRSTRAPWPFSRLPTSISSNVSATALVILMATNSELVARPMTRTLRDRQALSLRRRGVVILAGRLRPN